jgi:hypothetical protein
MNNMPNDISDPLYREIWNATDYFIRATFIEFSVPDMSIYYDIEDELENEI